MTRAEFLLARIAYDEVEAWTPPEHYAPFEREWEWCPKARTEPLGDLPGPEAPCECWVATWKPSRRVLAECAAKRIIVEHSEVWARTLYWTPVGYSAEGATAYRMAMDWVLEQMASVYADHADFPG